MNKRTLTFFGALALIVLSACQSGNKNTDAGTPEPDAPVYADTEHNSQNSLDWGGIYSGILPCPDCEGVMTVIELGYDLRFKRQRLYIGGSDEVISDQGKVTWDPSGSGITLTSEDPDTESVSYQVGENILFQLDQDGNRISGDLADRYQLSKPYFSIAEKYWQLIALDGKPVQTVEGQQTEPYILFHEKDQRFTGSGGCNRLQGGYELSGDGLITIGTVSATLMMCPDMTVEDRFSKALEQVERFTISNDTLVFYRQPKTEIARFRTVWFR